MKNKYCTFKVFNNITTTFFLGYKAKRKRKQNERMKKEDYNIWNQVSSEPANWMTTNLESA